MHVLWHCWTDLAEIFSGMEVCSGHYVSHFGGDCCRDATRGAENVVSVMPGTCTSDKVVFNTVDFVESRQSRLSCFGPRTLHTGDKVDRDKLSNLRCCWFVAKTGNKVEPVRQQSTLLPICCRFQQSRPCWIQFVASVYRALVDSAWQPLLHIRSLDGRAVALIWINFTDRLRETYTDQFILILIICRKLLLFRY